MPVCLGRLPEAQRDAFGLMALSFSKIRSKRFTVSGENSLSLWVLPDLVRQRSDPLAACILSSSMRCLPSRSNITKMAAGVPLEDRLPWLSAVRDHLRKSDGCVLACSALKKSYRSILADTSIATRFIHLTISRDCVCKGEFAAGSFYACQSCGITVS